MMLALTSLKHFFTISQYLEVLFLKKLGIRAHDLEAHAIEPLITTLKQLDVSTIQLALSKSFPALFNHGQLPANEVQLIADQLTTNHITVPILGCYLNIIDSNDQKRLTNLALFKQYLAIAHLFPGSVVATETGSVSPAGYTVQNFTQSAFQKVIESVTELVDYAHQINATVAIEPGVNHPLYNNQLVKQLIDQVSDQDHLKIIFDPVNLLTIDNYLDQQILIDQAIINYGPSIIACHLKDFQIINHQLIVVPFGKGALDTAYLFTKLDEMNPELNYFLETAKSPDIEQILAAYHQNNCEFINFRL
ncbi:Xylose isomerase domain-containing protein TIM barrel [Latilactobacillus fuchuensis]|uniref:Xylose isomerase domain-containing protein TIM barrel n=1 Tax=Latilactobacillus fuchuensis TaxID=164393 RepID=A0A2N9DUU8_9LACO|nr:Xylose isomerase domain-containing protein TIM barrel [Latilactobacillus fuchuensis]